MRAPISLVVTALVIAVLFPGSALAAAGGSDLPVRGLHWGYQTVDRATGQSHAITIGPVSHFGLTTVEQDVQAVPTGPGTLSWSGTWTLTTASGDQLSGTSSGTGSSSDGIHFTILGQYLSSGGTGRLAGASLSMDVTVQATVVAVQGSTATQAVDVTVVGTLSH